MPRGKKRRCCRVLEDEIIFKPAGIPMSELEIIEMELDYQIMKIKVRLKQEK